MKPSFPQAVPSLPLEGDWFPRPLPSNIAIGEGTYVYSAFAFLHYRSRRPCGLLIGRDNWIMDTTSFDLGPAGEVELGNNCTLSGPLISTNRRIVVGNYALISEAVFADSFAAVPWWRWGARDWPEGNAPPSVRPGTPTSNEPSIVLGDTVWIGMRAVLLPGARIGEGSIVGAGSVVDFEVPPFTVVAGNPARVVASLRPERGSTQQR